MGAQLYGRQVEIGRLEIALAQARSSKSCRVVIAGEPGVGKTALLNVVEERARACGTRVLRARGTESEAHLSLAAIADLVGPIRDDRSGLPAPLRQRLDGALGIGPPALTAPFALGVAVLATFAKAAEKNAVLVAVDDVQWIDDASLQILSFVARRMHHDAIAFVVCHRLERETPAVLDGWEVIRLNGLDLPAVQDLLAARVGEAIDGATAQRLLRVTNGNPLALIESSLGRSTADLRLMDDADIPVPESLRRAFIRRLDRLPPATRRALVVVAMSPSGRVEHILRAISMLRLPESSLDAAEREEIFIVENGCARFSHPLLRSTVVQIAEPDVRREAAGVLAEAAPSGSEERAWCLAQAAHGPDAVAADALAEVAQRSLLAAGPLAAWPAFVESARMTPSSVLRAERLVAASRVVLAAGRVDDVDELLAEAGALSSDPLHLAAAALVRGQRDMYTGDVLVGVAEIAAAARMLAPIDPIQAGMMLGFAALPAGMEGSLEAGLQLSVEGLALVRGTDTIAEAICDCFRAAMLAGLGRVAEIGTALDRYCELAPWRDPYLATIELAPTPAQALCWSDDLKRARHVLEEAIGVARSHGAPAALPYNLAVLAQVNYWDGRWFDAAAAAAEGVELATLTGQPMMAAWANLFQAYIAAARGEETACRGYVAVMRSQQCGSERRSISVYIEHVLGLLELGLGHADSAATHLASAAQIARAREPLSPAVVRFDADLIDAHIGAGRFEAARNFIDELLTLEASNPTLYGAVAIARGRALLSGDDEYETAFAHAMATANALGSPFETARTRLAYGERLRRRRRSIDAREHLRAAHYTFVRLAAAPWTRRAEAELRASGDAVGRVPTTPSFECLSPQELQVALAVAGGQTNRAAAATLFISPKTIEFHLAKVYRKLGIRSRSQLVQLAAEARASSAT